MQTFILGMDWNAHENDLAEECLSFGNILEGISRIHCNEHTLDLGNPAFVKALVTGCQRTASVRTLCGKLWRQAYVSGVRWRDGRIHTV